MRKSVLPLLVLLLLLAGCHSTRNVQPAERQAAQVLHEAAYGSGDFDPCARRYPICGPGESPGTSMCERPRCRGGHVVELSLSGDQMEALPAEIGDLPYLEILHLSGDYLTGLPTEIGLLSQLESLNVYGTHLTNLPAEIGQLTNLKSLRLSSNELTSLPPEMGRLSKLESLDLSGNQLTSLPPEIGQLNALKSLSLSGNPLADLPSEIGELAQLRYLSLHDTSMGGPLPVFLTRLPLESFNFRATGLCVPHDEAVQNWLMSVERVDVLSPSVACALDEGEQAALLALYENAGHPEDWSLDAPSCTWPGVACDWTGHVTQLTLTHSQLAELPAEIGQLKHLRILNLSENQLTRLPPEIGHLSDLEWLYLHNNQLVELPAEIGEFGKLEDLLLFDNQLRELPPEIGQLVGLSRLDISGNPLSGPMPSFLTSLSPRVFAFEATALCIPNDTVILAWLESLDYVQVPWLIEHRGCTD